jgi:hypothetical protein
VGYNARFTFAAQAATVAHTAVANQHLESAFPVLDLAPRGRYKVCTRSFSVRSFPAEGVMLVWSHFDFFYDGGYALYGGGACCSGAPLRVM